MVNRAKQTKKKVKNNLTNYLKKGCTVQAMQN